MTLLCGKLGLIIVICCFACEGPMGEIGPRGQQGFPGQKGDKGDGGEIIWASNCMFPCHGNDGIRGLSQFGTSGHFLNGMKHLTNTHYQKAWLSNNKSCGNCHAEDALVSRSLALFPIGTAIDLSTGQISYWNSRRRLYSEIRYGGDAEIGIISCRTCHNTISMHNTVLYRKRSWNTLSFGNGATIEKSPIYGKVTGTTINFGKGNICIKCHKSRNDITHYLSSRNEITSTSWGPHIGPQSDIFSGVGGYDLENVVHCNSAHSSIKNGCVACHMPPASIGNPYPNHSFKAKIKACNNCHNNEVEDFNYRNIQTNTKKLLTELQLLLNNLGVLTRGGNGNPILVEGELGGNFDLDKSRPGVELSKNEAGVLYNYFLVVRGGAYGIHNPQYVTCLLKYGISYLKK
jgi:hypothetical protein